MNDAARPPEPVAQPPAELRARLAGVRGLLLDLDGVIVLRGAAIAGSGEALAALHRRGIAYRVLTNMSLMSRAGVAAQAGRLGMHLPAERIVTAASATAAATARRFDGQPIYVLCAPDGRAEFAGQRLLSHREAADPKARAAAVVVGDAAEEFTPLNLQSAFRLVRGGAKLVAMHRNRWWLTPEGEKLDAGGFVAGLEYATGRRAWTLGKPSPAIFREASRELGLPASELAMVGDDIWSDVGAAQRTGLRGVLVLTGKHGPADLRRAAAARRPVVPDAVAASLAEVVAALD